MQRRKFIQTTIGGSMALAFGGLKNVRKTHYISLSFDDGFKKSFYRIAEIHEEYGLNACLNVIATGHLPTFKAEPKWIPQRLLGSFDDWNALSERGHEIMPHSWKHLNLTKISFENAKDNIEKCIDCFNENLSGYSSIGAVYNFAYNASNPELEDFALTKFSAIRTWAGLVLNDTMINKFPVHELPLRLGCWTYGPDLSDFYVEQEVEKFLDSEGGWLILNLHGLDNEGWGPISSKYLDSLLRRLIKIDFLKISPTGELVKQLCCI